jgi:hypothetical protein
MSDLIACPPGATVRPGFKVVFPILFRNTPELVWDGSQEGVPPDPFPYSI